jgi:predicted nucleic acid-binding protein
MKKLRIYLDTSVFGGCFDDEFAEESTALIEMVKRSDIQLVVSELLFRELENAPEDVRELAGGLPDENIEAVMLDDESESLRDAYLNAKVVGPAHRNDAMHVALATVAKVDMIVSWNFKHIVHYEKMRGFNAVNLRKGYMPIEIHCPAEVV